MCDTKKINKVKSYLRQYFGKTAGTLLGEIIFWAQTNSGRVVDGRRWIYNTQDVWAKKLGVSRSTFCRALKDLRERNLVHTKKLNYNKRNQTLYYSVNIEELRACLRLQNNNVEKVVYSNLCDIMAGTKNDTIYTDINLQKINKSNKSTASVSNSSCDPGLKTPTKKVRTRPVQVTSVSTTQVSSHAEAPKLASAHVSECSEDTSVEAVNATDATTVTQAKPTIVQDMVRIWNKIFPKFPCVLDKQIARYLVAAFKRKFNESLEEWERYLKLIKTSAFVMKDTFRLAIDWVIRFVNIDKFRTGWCGTKTSEIPVVPEDTAKITANHIDTVQESERCKEIRRQIAKKISCENYNNWFTHVELVEIHEEIFEEIPEEIYTEIYMKTDSTFARDYIMQHFQSEIGLDFLPDNGEKTSSAQSLEKIINDAKTHPNDLAEAKNAMDHIDAVQESQRCKEARKKIAEQISPDLYNKWFTHVKLVENDGEILMKADCNFVRDQVSQKFGYKIANVTLDPKTASPPVERYASSTCNAEATSAEENASLSRIDSATPARTALPSVDKYASSVFNIEATSAEENASSTRMGSAAPARTALPSVERYASAVFDIEATSSEENASPTRIGNACSTGAILGEIIGNIAANRNNASSFTNNFIAS
ncbi:hypothetical protein FACS1894122_07280 [Alphaproteobacteria bacterium]|nr:hypothetical protein FACS1894122_07280 [Alphaproteobacteria bacterium]